LAPHNHRHTPQFQRKTPLGNTNQLKLCNLGVTVDTLVSMRSRPAGSITPFRKFGASVSSIRGCVVPVPQEVVRWRVR